LYFWAAQLFYIDISMWEERRGEDGGVDEYGMGEYAEGGTY
jgi:hypothetical protein